MATPTASSSRTYSTKDSSSITTQRTRNTSSTHIPPGGQIEPLSQTAIMKPVVSAMQAWQCTVISVFGIVILGVLGILFGQNHPELVGGDEDPKDGSAVAGTIFISVLIYIGFFIFCGLQGLLHIRENRRGAIAL
ncbi:Uncharacterized protein CTA1_4936 [Colletotrichum tanaceti]|uniref:Uncharacterized protein n=1 Tax=Colletotrichum tanaceti TaxID=1306861 RepID=A0A4U6XW49_9PEZI|nr:Uncharacterized protein CTA1_4936 [Colletotrichum tanaceti]